MYTIKTQKQVEINSLNAELNPICHLLVLLGARPILHISRMRVKLDESVLKTTGYTKQWVNHTTQYSISHI
jgi:hypothetical protein